MNESYEEDEGGEDAEVKGVEGNAACDARGHDSEGDGEREEEKRKQHLQEPNAAALIRLHQCSWENGSVQQVTHTGQT